MIRKGCLRIAVVATVLSVIGPLFGQTVGQREDRESMINGVHEILAPGAPGPLVLTSGDAFAVVDALMPDGSPAPVVAGGAMGEGRFVAFGHTGYAGGEIVDQDLLTGRLIARSVLYVLGDEPLENPPRVGATDAGLTNFFARLGMAATHLQGADWTPLLDDLDVVVCAQGDLEEHVIRDLRTFVEGGGGLLLSGLGWGWLELNPGRMITEHPGNRLLGPAGVYWARGSFKPADRFEVLEELDADLNSAEALRSLLAGRGGFGGALRRAVETLPSDDQTLRPEIDELIDRYRAEIIPSERDPVDADSMEGMIITAELRDTRDAAPDDVFPHPAAEVFPGAVTAAVPRRIQRFEIDASRPGWHSTGAYAPAGSVIEIVVPEAAAGHGLDLRIGCHKDRIDRQKQWRRIPEITRVFPIYDMQIKGACAFGGPIYIVVPEDCEIGEIEVMIDGAVVMPRFVLGETSISDWRLMRTRSVAPWAELETDKIILTVPTEAILDLQDPEPMLHFWNDVLDGMATLAGRPLERDRPERIIADVQISAGYMHAGYPIMTHLDAAPTMVDIDDLRDGAWGLYHELGHNHQSSDWTFNGTGEVTCNLFALYVSDTLCELPEGERGHQGVTGDVGIDRYLAEGADFDTWQREPFLALRMYVQLVDAFGWEPFERVFAEYRDLGYADRPRNDPAKRDQWLVRMSRTVEHDLGPFFESWGVPTSDAARASIAELPEWMPEGWEGTGAMRGFIRSLPHDRAVRSVVFSADGGQLVTSTAGGAVMTWDVATGREVFGAEVGRALVLARRADGSLVGGGYVSNDEIAVWDVATGADVAKLRLFEGRDRATTLNAKSTPIAFSADGTRFVAATGWGRTPANRRVQFRRVWDASSFEQVAVIKHLAGWIRAAALSPDGGRLVTGLEQGEAMLWRLDTGTSVELTPRDGDDVRSVAFSADGSRVIVAKAGSAVIYDVSLGEALRTVTPEDFDAPFSVVAFSPDGRYLVAGFERGSITVWDARTWQEIVTAREHTGTVLALAFSPDCTMLASSATDSAVKLWGLGNAETPKR